MKASSIGNKIFNGSFKSEQKRLISKIYGSWVKSIGFDDKEFWNVNNQCYNLLMDYDVLPSDWRFREDLLWIAYGKTDNANAWKSELEQLNRTERKSREKYSKKIKH